MIKEFNSSQGPTHIDLTEVLSCKDSIDKKTNEACLYIRMSNGDFWNLTNIAKAEFVTHWRAAKGE